MGVEIQPGRPVAPGARRGSGRRVPGSVWIIAGFVLARAAAAAVAPLIDDEAYYWLWAQRLDWGYRDHPPMIAWLIALTTVPADSPVWIRVSPLGLGACTTYTLFLFGRELFGVRAGYAAAALFQVVPVLAGAGLLATPDAPLLLCWVASMRLAWHALHGRPQRWLAAGAVAGLGLLSKVPMVLLPVGLLLYVLVRAPRTLRGWQPYAGAALAALLFAPVVVWNARHGWAGLEHLLGSRLTAEQSAVAGLTGVGKLLEEQMPFALALLPAYAWALLVPLRRPDPALTFLALATLPAVVLPFIPAFAGAWPHGNSLAPAYLTLSLVLGAAWTRAVAVLAALNGAAIAWGLVVSLVPALPLLPGAEEVYGWREAGARVAAEMRALQADGGLPGGTGAAPPSSVPAIVADRYQVAAQLGYHGPGGPVTLLPCPPRGSIWASPRDVMGRSGIAVIDARWEPAVAWAGYAGEVEEQPPLRLALRGRPLRTFKIYRLHALRAPEACP